MSAPAPSEPRQERLQKILARAGVASRRGAEELIRAGRVTVNGSVAELGSKADPEHDAIKLDGRRVRPRTEFHYLLLNKPSGVMSTRSDPAGRPTVLDLVPPGSRKALVPVGRLDFQTEGLLLLTDDGDLAQRVAHPRYGCLKTYEVKVRGRPEEKALDRLRAGIRLEGRKTAPCRIVPRRLPPAARAASRAAARAQRIASRKAHSHPGAAPAPRDDGGNSWWTVELGEGRTRQIREMFQRIGHPVMRLRRVAIGPLSDPALPLGKARPLSDAELAQLRQATAGGEKAPPRQGPPRRRPKP